MKYIIESDNLGEMLPQIEAKLSAISVKGDDVANMFTARLLLKQIFESIKKIEEDEPKEGE